MASTAALTVSAPAEAVPVSPSAPPAAAVTVTPSAAASTPRVRTSSISSISRA